MIKKVNIQNLDKKYDSGEIRTRRIENFAIWRQETNFPFKYLKQEDFIKKLDEEVNSLIESRTPEFKILFGKQDFIYRSDYNKYTWLVESDNGCRALFLSAKGRGTDVEIIVDDQDDPLAPVESFFYEYKDLMQYLYFEKDNVSKENYKLYLTAKNYNL